MSFLRKIQSLLFDEEDEEIEDETYDKVEIESQTMEVKVDNDEYTKETETVMLEPKTSASQASFKSIEVDQEPITKKRETYSANKENIEINKPVISPMFGFGETNVEEGVIQNVTKTPKNKKRNPLNTVISPMFGSKELEEHEKQAKTKIALNEYEQQSEFQMNLKDEKDQLSLKDLIQDDLLDSLETTAQISFFGDPVSVHEQEDEQYVVDDEEKVS